MKVNNDFLRQMVGVDALQPLLEAFGDVCQVGAGIFAPSGDRIGTPAHHGPVCSLLYETQEGRNRCEACDRRKVQELMAGDGRAPEPYPCHAGLIDFCEPIYCHLGGERCLIGVFFAGQVLYRNFVPTRDTIRQLRTLAHSTAVDPDELLARLVQVPRLSPDEIGRVRSWMKHIAELIGVLLERRAAAQSLLLDVINVVEDQSRVVQAIQQHLRPAAVSIFLRKEEANAEGDVIHLIATTFEGLAQCIPPVTQALAHAASYRRKEGLTGWVYDTGLILHIANVRDVSLYPSTPYRPQWLHKVKEIRAVEDTKAFLGVPIRKADGDTVGVIRAVRLRTDPDFSPDEVELLVGIAALLSSAFFKADLSRLLTRKIAALTEAETLLRTLTEPNASLESTATRMVRDLGTQYLLDGHWRAVYVLQHMCASRQFRIVAYAPETMNEAQRGGPFPEDQGVAGWVLKNLRPFAEADCRTAGVNPTTPWTSVICVPIFRGSEMWGAVSLCGNDVPVAEVNGALPQIATFAQHIGIVCELSEVFDAKRTAATVASNILSLNLEAHEAYKSLEAAKIAGLHLCEMVSGEARMIAEDIVREIDDGLSWSDVCVELGRYIRCCQNDPGSAIDAYRAQHMASESAPLRDPDRYAPWEVVDLVCVARRAVEAVWSIAQARGVRLEAQFPTESCALLSDPNLLFRAIRNLLENAVVHGPGTGLPGHSCPHSVCVSLVLERGDAPPSATIRVADDGLGIGPESLTAAREVYSAPTRMGLTSLAPGFGTMIVAFAVGVHGGRISIDSGPGLGTRVVVELPLRGT